MGKPSEINYRSIIMAKFKEFGIMLGCAENAVPKISSLERFVDYMSLLGYNALYLEIADTYKIDSEPYFGYMRGGYSADEIVRLDAYCKKKGVELVPAIQTLAHLHFLNNYERFRPIIDLNDILLAGEDETYRLIDEMFASLSRSFSSRRVNIGMDEAYLLGDGKYYYKNGRRDRIDILLDHLRKVAEIAARYGFKCEMWSDVFFNALTKGHVYEGNAVIIENIKDLVPEGVKLVYWEYFVTGKEQCEKMIELHRQITPDVKYAGTFFRWQGFAPCNVFTQKVMKRALPACAEKGVEDVFFAVWSDYGGGASWFSILPAMWYLSRYTACGFDETKMDFFEFRRLFGVDYADFVLLDALNRPYTDFTEKKVSDERINNKCFFYTYNDVLYGTFDSLLSDGISAAYENTANNLEKIDAGEFGYIFDELVALARFLSVKADLGKRIYAAYGAGRTEELRSIAEKDLPLAADLLDEFCKRYEKRYLKENKPFGFESACVRLGGLKERLAFAKRRLDDYLSGAIGSIEELDEEHLPLGYASDRTEDNYEVDRYTNFFLHGFL